MPVAGSAVLIENGHVRRRALAKEMLSEAELVVVAEDIQVMEVQVLMAKSN